MVVVVYTNEIVLWDAETGEVCKRIEDIVQEVTTIHSHCVPHLMRLPRTSTNSTPRSSL